MRSLLAGHTYACSVVATNFFGTSAESNTKLSHVGVPKTRVVRVMRLAHGLAMAFVPAQANGSPITNYRARCTSTDGGLSSSPLQLTSPIVASRLTAGKTYICKVTAINGRGEGPPTTIGPYVAALPELREREHGELHRTQRKPPCEPGPAARRQQAAHPEAVGQVREVLGSLREGGPARSDVPVQDRVQLQERHRQAERRIREHHLDGSGRSRRLPRPRSS